jgi:hypothetical protein
MALCNHEQAERVQVRLERLPAAEAANFRSDAVDAWETAVSSWRTYEQCAAAHSGFPGRAAHARQLAARAVKFAIEDAKR